MDFFSQNPKDSQQKNRLSKRNEILLNLEQSKIYFEQERRKRHKATEVNLTGGIIQTALQRHNKEAEFCSELKNRNDKKFGRSIEKFMESLTKNIQEKNKSTYKFAQLISF